MRFNSESVKQREYR